MVQHKLKLLHLQLCLLHLILSNWHPVATSSKVELSSSAILFYNSEFQPMYGSNVSQCELLVRRAAAHGGRRIQFVPTHYWFDAKDSLQNPNTCYPDNWADTDLKVDYYCSKFEWNSKCEPFNAASIRTFKEGMQGCFATALQLFDEVLIAPHLDPAVTNSKRSKWRNMLRFDPMWKDPYGYSYYDIMLFPLLQAANATFIKLGQTLQLAMGGEMGGTLLAFPLQYINIMRQMRAGWKSSSKLLLGITFYHAYIPGQIIHGPGPVGPSPDSPKAKYDGGYGPLLPFSSWPGVAALKAELQNIKQLVTQAEFIGVSNYARAPDAVAASDIESSTSKLFAEFAMMGIDLKQHLQSNPQKLFIWNEFALGGGVGSCGDTPGTNTRVGLFPWLGITSSYNITVDPFKRSPVVKTYLVKYYNVALDVLHQGGKMYKVHAAYIWNCGSWDVQGIHPSSSVWNTSVAQGDWPVVNGFAVQEVIDMIKLHNAR